MAKEVEVINNRINRRMDRQITVAVVNSLRSPFGLSPNNTVYLK